MIAAIGALSDEASVSRADLCVDFITDYPINTISDNQWVTRAKRLAQHSDNRRFSGISVAAGSPLSARLYNKTLEMKKNPRPYLEAIWKEQGWDGVSDVWRLEFQFRRQALRDLNVISYSSLIKSLAGIWRYSTHEWLRHTFPNNGDVNQTRWPLSSLWEALQGAPWSGATDVHRTNSERSRGPSDRTLFVNGLSPLTSFMARDGYLDIGEASAAFLEAAKIFHNNRDPQITGSDFESYVSSKVREKRKSYNTARNMPHGEKPHPADIAVAREYRKRSNGDY